MFPIRTLLRGLARYWYLPAAAVALAATFAAASWWEATRALQHGRAQAQADATLAFTFRPVQPQRPVDAVGMAPAAAFRDAIRFQQRFYAAGPLGLVEYGADGAPLRRFHPGLELPPAEITSLAVGLVGDTREPALLIATAGEGLLIFDGGRLRQMRPALAGHRKLTAVLAVGAGRLLLGTDTHGLLEFDGRALTVAHPGLANVHVTALAGTDGDVWVGTLDRGVLHWRAGAVDRFGEADGLPDPRVVSLAVAGPRAYVGTPLGVAELRDGRYTRVLAPGLFAGALAIRDQTLLVATLDETVATIPLETRASRGTRSLERDTPGIVRRFVDADGALYALTDDAVLAVDGRSAWRTVVGPAGGSLSDRNVSALAVDGSGRVWVGYFDRGLDVLDRGGTRLSHVENDRVFCVNRIVHDTARGVTAVATANGLVLFDGAVRQRQVLGRRDGLIADHVTDVLLSARGMAVATPAGLTLIEPDGSRSLYAFHGLVNNHVYALGASGSELLAGTLGGVSTLDAGLIRASYTTANSALTHNWITAIVRVDDEWFVGTYGGGLFRLDGRGVAHPLPGATGAFEVNPNAMLVTDTHVFAGTLAKGLLVYDRQSRHWTTTTAGLPSLNVTALAAHGEDVYVGTDNGIVRVREQNFGHP